MQVAYGLELKFIVKVSLLFLDFFLFVDFFDKIIILILHNDLILTSMSFMSSDWLA